MDLTINNFRSIDDKSSVEQRSKSFDINGVTSQGLVKRESAYNTVLINKFNIKKLL